MPDSVEMPAPVSATTCCASRSHPAMTSNVLQAAELAQRTRIEELHPRSAAVDVLHRDAVEHARRLGVLEGPLHLHGRARLQREPRVTEEEQGVLAGAHDVRPRLIEMIEAVAQRRVERLHATPDVASPCRSDRKEASDAGAESAVR